MNIKSMSPMRILATLCLMLAVSDGCLEDNEVIEALFARYHPEVPPWTSIDPPIKGTGELLISRIVAVDAAKGGSRVPSFTFVVWITTKWTDKRLTYSDMNACSRTNITLRSFASRVWTPEIQAIDALAFHVLSSPHSSVFALMFPDGQVMHTYQARVTVPCDLFHESSLECYFRLESAQYNAGVFDLSWNDTVAIQELSVPGFKLNYMTVDTDTLQYMAGEWKSITNRFVLKKQEPSF